MAVTHAIGPYRVADDVLGAVRSASARTGVDFGYMMAKAAQESAFDPAARATTSSATGLYQFIDQTWLGMVKSHGPRYGLDGAAAAIEQGPDGRFSVSDPTRRREILDLRYDPRLNAVMAAEFAAGNEAHLHAAVGGEIGPTELYLAHFLGAGGAEAFLTAMRADPGRPAAEVFPAAARSNRPVFYEDGRPRSLAEMHAWIDRRMDRAMALADGAPGGAPSTAVAEVPPGPPAGPPGPFGVALQPWGRFAAAAGPFGWAGAARGAGPMVGSGSGLPPAAASPSVRGTPPDGSGLPGPSEHRRDVLPGAASEVGTLARDLAEKRLSLWTVLTASSLPTPGETGT